MNGLTITIVVLVLPFSGLLHLLLHNPLLSSHPSTITRSPPPSPPPLPPNTFHDGRDPAYVRTSVTTSDLSFVFYCPVRAGGPADVVIYTTPLPLSTPPPSTITTFLSSDLCVLNFVTGSHDLDPSFDPFPATLSYLSTRHSRAAAVFIVATDFLANTALAYMAHGVREGDSMTPDDTPAGSVVAVKAVNPVLDAKLFFKSRGMESTPNLVALSLYDMILDGLDRVFNTNRRPGLYFSDVISNQAVQWRCKELWRLALLNSPGHYFFNDLDPAATAMLVFEDESKLGQQEVYQEVIDKHRMEFSNVEIVREEGDVMRFFKRAMRARERAMGAKKDLKVDMMVFEKMKAKGKRSAGFMGVMKELFAD